MSKCKEICLKHLEEIGEPAQKTGGNWFILEYDFTNGAVPWSFEPLEYCLMNHVAFEDLATIEGRDVEHASVECRIGTDGGSFWKWDARATTAWQRRALSRLCGELNGEYSVKFVMKDDGELVMAWDLLVSEDNCAERLEAAFKSMNTLFLLMNLYGRIHEALHEEEPPQESVAGKDGEEAAAQPAEPEKKPAKSGERKSADGGAAAEKAPAETDLQPGQAVQFGTWQGKALRWHVIDVQGGRAMIMADEAVDKMPYHEECVPVTWETCSLRKWLNGEFYTEAFTDAEKQRIAEADVPADRNPQADTDPGNATRDKVFLLSLEEFNRLLMTRTMKEWRVCKKPGGDGGVYCWLRTPGCSPHLTAGVFKGG
ncbi:MAG: hypothetical protein J5855_10955, partial [Mailhella sp.]|nr:hypothetical protein [Mailhella sp.]